MLFLRLKARIVVLSSRLGFFSIITVFYFQNLLVVSGYGKISTAKREKFRFVKTAYRVGASPHQVDGHSSNMASASPVKALENLIHKLPDLSFQRRVPIEVYLKDFFYFFQISFCFLTSLSPFPHNINHFKKHGNQTFPIRFLFRFICKLIQCENIHKGGIRIVTVFWKYIFPKTILIRTNHSV